MQQRITRHDIADDLIDGIVSLLVKSVINRLENDLYAGLRLRLNVEKLSVT